MKQEYNEYEILEIETESKRVFKFLIKKLYWQSFIVENDKFSVSKEGLKIYFEKLPKDINTYNRVPWSIKWKRDFLRKNGEVKYAHSGMLKVDKKYRNIGLGSYLLDSLTQWAQENFNESTVNIQIVHEDYTDVPKSVIERFYGKRNLYNGVRVSEVKTFFKESEKFKVTSAVDYLLEIFKENLKLNENIDGLNKNIDGLFKRNQDLEKLRIRDKLLIFLSAVVSLALGWFLRGNLV